MASPAPEVIAFAIAAQSEKANAQLVVTAKCIFLFIVEKPLTLLTLYFMGEVFADNCAAQRRCLQNEIKGFVLIGIYNVGRGYLRRHSLLASEKDTLGNWSQFKQL